MFWSLCLIIIFIIVCGFSILNPVEVNVHYYVGQVHLPLAAVVILAFVVGGLLGMLIGWGKGRSSTKRKMKAKMAKLEAKKNG